MRIILLTTDPVYVNNIFILIRKIYFSKYFPKYEIMKKMYDMFSSGKSISYIVCWKKKRLDAHPRNVTTDKNYKYYPH